MVTYVLILFFHVGMMGDTDSNATTTVPGFINIQECQEAGNESKRLTSGSKKNTEFVCVKQTVNKE